MCQAGVLPGNLVTVPALELLAQHGRQNKCVKTLGHTDHSMTNPEGGGPHPESHREEVLFAWVLKDAWECVGADGEEKVTG